MLNIILSFCLLLIAGTGLFLSTQLPLFNNIDMLFSTKPSFYPTKIFGGLILCSLIYFIKSIIKFIPTPPVFGKKVIVILTFFVGYIISLIYLKFIASTLLFNIASGYYLLQDKSKVNVSRMVIVSISVTLILYILFVEFFNVPL